VAGSIVAAVTGCAALAGLDDPSPVSDVGDAAGLDVATGDVAPGTDGGAGVDANIGYGSGAEGAVVITDKRNVNSYAPLAASAAVGATTLMIGNQTTTATARKIAAGDVILIVQSATPGVRPPGDAAALDTPVGVWELAVVVALDNTLVTLAQPLAHRFDAPGAQIVRVPQTKTIEVTDSGALVAQKWDGNIGGVLALLATDSIVVDGALDSDSSGFRGGRAIDSEVVSGCNAGNGYVDAGFAPRGEGIGAVPAGYGDFFSGGRANAANGGGGGDCLNAGGAGGGNGGRGGVGGNSNDSNRSVGGNGGAALNVPPGTSRLRFGGGGGAGDDNSSTAGSGGTGGGVLFVRAPSLSGIGDVRARGGGGGGGADDGSGGGGAGGTVWLDLAMPPVCKRIAVGGGKGGDSTGFTGPGGGGGGGVVFLRGGLSPTTCPVDFQAGGPGLCDGAAYGAGPPADQRNQPPYIGLLSGDLSP